MLYKNNKYKLVNDESNVKVLYLFIFLSKRNNRKNVFGLNFFMFVNKYLLQIETKNLN